MKTICLQFQPERTRVPVARVSALLLRIALEHKDVRQFTVQRGVSKQYVNYLFVGPGVRSIWNVVEITTLRHQRIGKGLRRACIATAEGSRGWNNYLLLHHFDSRQNLDKLPRN
jgi:hypothetical protein